jgi:hypothetical protein
MSSVYIRAGDPNFTLVMVDGIPLNDAMNPRGGSVDLSLIDLIDAERMRCCGSAYLPRPAHSPAVAAGRQRPLVVDVGGRYLSCR